MGIIKNYEDLINKTKFNKIIIEKKKQYGYIQFNKNGIFVTILDEYDNSLSKEENLIKNLELWIENNIEYPCYIQNMNCLINDIIKRCSINKLVEYKTANNEFIIEDDSTRELHIYDFMNKKYKYCPENNYIIQKRISIDKIENFNNLNIDIVEEILKNYINNDKMFKDFKKLINAIFFRNNKEPIIFKAGRYYSLYYDIINLFLTSFNDTYFINYRYDNRKEKNEHIRNLKKNKLYDNVRFIGIREDTSNYEEIIDKYIKEEKINVFIIYNDKYRFETEDIIMEKKNIDLNIKNYLEKNIDVIKNIINDNESYYDMLDLFQLNSKLKLNFFKWCININK